MESPDVTTKLFTISLDLQAAPSVKLPAQTNSDFLLLLKVLITHSTLKLATNVETLINLKTSQSKFVKHPELPSACSQTLNNAP
jgi:hypothetical protein